MRPLSFSVAMALTMLAATLCSAQPAQLLGETNPLAILTGNRFQGLWWAQSVPDGSPVILTIGRSGVVELHTASDAGGHLPFELSEMRGIWRRARAREAAVVLMRFLYNLDGTIRGVVRGQGVMRFGENFDILELIVENDQFSCESIPNPPGAPPGTTPACQDVLTVPPDSTRTSKLVARRVPFGAQAR